MELCHTTLSEYLTRRNQLAEGKTIVISHVRQNNTSGQTVDTVINASVVEGLLSALDYLHSNHVIHRYASDS